MIGILLKITNILKRLLISSVVIGVLLNQTSYAYTGDGKRKEPMNGAWVCTVYNLDFPKTENFEEEYKALLSRLEAEGINTIVFQVRPSGDAFYNSKIVKRSPYIKGCASDYDPMKFVIEETHKRGMEFHAWFNPFRVTTSGTKLSSGDPLNQYKQHIVEYQGKLYLDPGKPEVRKYLRDVILEYLNQYDVDAIHFDDYFYPARDFNDNEAYQKYGKGQDRFDWRRNNINTFVRNIQKLAHRKGVEFGISPSGVWRNKGNDERGSETTAFSSYDDIQADSLYWVKNEIVDYIVPQIYWTTDSTSANYVKLVDWWSNVVKGTKVDLYIGQGIYKPEVKNEIQKQLSLNLSSDEVKGSIYFSANNISNLPKPYKLVYSSNKKLSFYGSGISSIK